MSLIDVAILALASTVSCPVQRAHYVLRGHTDVVAAFRSVESGREWPSKLVLIVTARQSGATTWWLPWQGGTDEQTNIASTTDVTRSEWRPPSPDGGPRPQGNRHMIFADVAYTIADRVPSRGDAAPAHLLVPDGGGAHDAAFPVRQFFDLTGCE